MSSPQESQQSDHDKIFLDQEMMRLLTEFFDESERSVLSESFLAISDNIADVFEGMTNQEIMMARNITFHEIFRELAKVMPYYIPLLKASVDEFGDEMYFTKEEMVIELGKEALKNNQFFPKLLIDDGSRAFALMQIAAYKAVVADDNLKLWYLMISGLITAVTKE